MVCPNLWPVLYIRRSSVFYLFSIVFLFYFTVTDMHISSVLILCIALCFLANGSFLYNVGDAENTVCRAVHRAVTVIKYEFHGMAGK